MAILPRSIVGGLANTTNAQRVMADLLLEQQKGKLAQSEFEDAETRRKAQELFGRSLAELLGPGAMPMAPPSMPQSPAPGQPSVPMGPPASAPGAPGAAAGAAPGVASPGMAAPAVQPQPGMAPAPAADPLGRGPDPYSAASILGMLQQRARQRMDDPRTLGAAFQSIYPLYADERKSEASMAATSAYRQAQLEQQRDSLGMQMLQLNIMANNQNLTRDQRDRIAQQEASLAERRLALDTELGQARQETAQQRAETERLRAENARLGKANSPAALKRADAMRQMEDTRRTIAEVREMLKRDPGLVGASGKVRRGASSVIEQTGGAADVPADELATKLRTIQDQVGGPLLNLRNWSGVAQKRLTESVPGLGWFDNPEKVRSALDNIDSILATALGEETAQGEATGEMPAPAPPAGAQGNAYQSKIAPPTIGEVRDGYRFKGGDPAMQESWEPVAGAR